MSNFESALGPDHPDVGVILNNLAVFHFAQQEDWGKSVTYLRRGTGITVSARGAGPMPSAGRRPARLSVRRPRQPRVSVLVKAAHRLADAGNADASELAGEMFRTAQWGLGTEASASLAQMAARQARGDNALARFVRERQDLIGEWQARDKLLIAARAEAPARRNARTEAELNQRLIGIDTRIAEIDRALAKDFPDYTALAAPEPLSVDEVQGDLGPTRPLCCSWSLPMQPTHEETFIWAVTKTDARWVRVDLGTEVLTATCKRCAAVSILQLGRATRCFDRTTQIYTGNELGFRQALPFDLSRAHALYGRCSARLQDLIPASTSSSSLRAH